MALRAGVPLGGKIRQGGQGRRPGELEASLGPEKIEKN